MIRVIQSKQPQREQPKRGSRLPWSVVLPWGLTGAILVGTAVLAFIPRGVRTEQPPPGQAGALVWGNGVFSNALELEAWLRIRGVSYKTWARRHPAGVKLVTPRAIALGPGSTKAAAAKAATARKAAAKKVAARKAAATRAAAAKAAATKAAAARKARATPVKQSKAARPGRTAAATRADAPADSSGRPSWLLPVLVACAGLGAFLVFRLRLPARWRWARVDDDGPALRIRNLGGYAGLALAAVGLGFLVPLLFG